MEGLREGEFPGSPGGGGWEGFVCSLIGRRNELIATPLSITSRPECHGW